LHKTGEVTIMVKSYRGKNKSGDRSENGNSSYQEGQERKMSFSERLYRAAGCCFGQPRADSESIGQRNPDANRPINPSGENGGTSSSCQPESTAMEKKFSEERDREMQALRESQEELTIKIEEGRFIEVFEQWWNSDDPLAVIARKDRVEALKEEFARLKQGVASSQEWESLYSCLVELSNKQQPKEEASSSSQPEAKKSFKELGLIIQQDCKDSSQLFNRKIKGSS
jgi:hypothetical protein